jgi:serine/threonine protein kinase
MVVGVFPAYLQTLTLIINHHCFRSSPEIIIDDEYSNASDMWGFGVLIWEMFTFVDKELNETDEEISCLPYHQLSSKEEVHLSEGLYCPYDNVKIIKQLMNRSRTN